MKGGNSWVIRESSKQKMYWDIFIIFLAVYNCFSIPFILAFSPVYADTDWNFVFETLIDFTFLVDICVALRTTYIDSLEGEEIYSPKKIALNYVKNPRFYLDLFSTIPFDKMFEEYVDSDGKQILNALGMLKLVRITKISILI